MSIYKIILADNQELVREGLKWSIHAKSEMKIIEETGDGQELLNLLQKTKPDLVIISKSIMQLEDNRVIAKIKSSNPSVKILCLGKDKDREHLFQVISAGADGYILIEATINELLLAIESIKQNKVYLSPALTELSLIDWSEQCRREQKPSGNESLSAREREVLKLIASGKGNIEIGNLMCISRHTVARHRANILGKLKLKSTASLIKYAIENGHI